MQLQLNVIEYTTVQMEVADLKALAESHTRLLEAVKAAMFYGPGARNIIESHVGVGHNERECLICDLQAKIEEAEKL